MSAPVPRPQLDALRARARGHGPLPMAVAWPCSIDALDAALAAERDGLIEAVLVGPRARIDATAQSAGLSGAKLRIEESDDDPRAAACLAVDLAKRGRVGALMKGSLHTDEFLGAALARDAGLRTARRVSHAFVLDVPGLGRPLLVSDCVVNIAPDLAAKRDIVQNAIDLAHALGIASPKVALLSAIEDVNPAIAATVDAAALSKMADRGQIEGGIVDGPLGFDNAVSAEAARIKGIVSPVAGAPDVLVVPALEAGNILYKALVRLGGAECAGIILGTRVPIVLTSRADSRECRIASCALAVVHAHAARAAAPAAAQGTG
ncbi:MAG: bifunctional enoyl-CoA hydratase/phosphate acetyltransferase [Proteobacteria bacterium]|nr:bifunctional enoyl-CoA hydratase/phosphate acetyltransferase [Pseudomonadota bacterium]